MLLPLQLMESPQNPPAGKLYKNQLLPYGLEKQVNEE
jgi:hypothetical protein